MTHFTPLAAMLGGLLIGAAAALLLALNGRTAGVSGIVAGALRPKPGELVWRLCFVLGLMTGGIAMAALRPESFESASPGAVLVAVAGVLVGFGTQLGNGCTSGHGVCGISRLSKRSIVGTITFMMTAGVTVFITHHVIGGGR